jgi:hypothetical protein
MMVRMDRPTATMAFFLPRRRDPPVPFAQGRVGPSGGDGGLAQDLGQVGVAVSGGPAALLAARRIP